MAFESTLNYLRSNDSEPILRDVTEEATHDWSTSLGEVGIVGGGIAVRLKSARASVPAKLAAADVEILEFLAVAHVEDDGTKPSTGLWWMRHDELMGTEHAAEQRQWWSKVDRSVLPEPLFAPATPSSVGAKEQWGALLAHVLEKHNTGELKGFISGAARGVWLESPLVYPTLLEIRERNFAAIQRALPPTLHQPQRSSPPLLTALPCLPCSPPLSVCCAVQEIRRW